MNIIEKIRWLNFLNNITKDKTMMEKLKSRKLWSTVGVAALTALLGNLGIAPEWSAKIIDLVMTYVVTQGVVDAVAVAKTPAAPKK